MRRADRLQSHVGRLDEGHEHAFGPGVQGLADRRSGAVRHADHDRDLSLHRGDGGLQRKPGKQTVLEIEHDRVGVGTERHFDQGRGAERKPECRDSAGPAQRVLQDVSVLRHWWHAPTLPSAHAGGVKRMTIQVLAPSLCGVGKYRPSSPKDEPTSESFQA